LKSNDDAWALLEQLGVVELGGELIDHRNCPCGGTLGRLADQQPGPTIETAVLAVCEAST
jgi:hypothetical protein